MGEDRARDRDGTVEVGAELPVQFLRTYITVLSVTVQMMRDHLNERHLFNESTLHVSGIVHQNVDPAVVDFHRFAYLGVYLGLR